MPKLLIKPQEVKSSNSYNLHKIYSKVPIEDNLQLSIVQPITGSNLVSNGPSFLPYSNASLKPIEKNDTNVEIIKLTTKMVQKSVTEASKDLNLDTSIQLDNAKLASTSDNSRDASNNMGKAKPGRKSKYAQEEDQKEKKVRSLERNRAAAMRCRKKRKMWIQALERKATEMEKLNGRLQVN